MGKERACDRLHWRKTRTKTHQHQRLFLFASFSLPHSFPTYCIYFCVCVSFFMQAVWQQAYERKMPHLHKKPFSCCVILGFLFPNFFSFSSRVWICLSLISSTWWSYSYIQIVALFSLDSTVFLLQPERDKYCKGKVELLFCMK